MKYMKKVNLKKTVAYSLSAAYLLLAGCSSIASPQISDNFTTKEVYNTLEFVSDWQWSQYNAETNLFEGLENSAYMSDTDADSHPQGWVYAAFHVGMAKWAKLADENGEQKYFDQLHKVAKRNKYLVAPRIYNADDYAIGQLYLDLYEKYNDPKMIAPLKTIFEIILNSPSSTDLYFKKIEVSDSPKPGYGELPFDEYEGRKFAIVPCKNRWCWADALFMAPPVWMHLSEVTGDKRYLEFADKEFWETANLLWDKDDHLFFRDTRFFDMREANGEKVIWARGVGWVVAGLARILERLPEDHAKRPEYEKIFQQVMDRLAGAQQNDGFWRPSVLAPESQPYKESSGTALILYAYASGVNQGVLKKEKYDDLIENAWSALVGVVNKDGKLGWVQPIGASPDTVTAEDTQIYGVGAFLMAGSEIYRMLDK